MAPPRIDSNAMIVGRGPRGERAASPVVLELTDAEAQRARTARFKVGVTLHTADLDWSQQQLDGITATLEDYGAEVAAVRDCRFDPTVQSAQLRELARSKLDAIISIPVDDTATAGAHREVAQAGITLVLIDNVPRGMEPHRHYASVVSSDNLGNGLVGAQSLSPFVPAGGAVGVIGFAADFFATEQREKGFVSWFAKHRADVAVHRTTFADPDDAERIADALLTERPDIDGLFAVWDGPALGALRAARRLRRDVAITTVDLGVEAATELAGGGLIKGIGAQQPYDQGVAEALVAINALLGHEPPPWVAVPALATTRENVAEAFERVWHRPPPAAVRHDRSSQTVTSSAAP